MKLRRFMPASRTRAYQTAVLCVTTTLWVIFTPPRGCARSWQKASIPIAERERAFNDLLNTTGLSRIDLLGSLAALVGARAH